MSDFLKQLRFANQLRMIAWDPDMQLGPLFHATELGEEVGEVLGAVKKLERERMGLLGSRISKDALAEELGDALICLDKLAICYGIDLAKVTAAKFNSTSEKVGLPQRLALPEE